ncbi:lipopolysaccharide biosynthesis protein [Leucobacter sp. CSA1]|uniref:Lipopolysaccharide biosynthesis protein n=1 Tax=Leucobacter chromiisoli TaxID=2796471 RepID=A0A934Q989_9MICO|nr:lipopolysaccharide biosynthesis protein [Leucobacter chromiisoli]MBK0419476.1 lipopolysaccharide biosynthesis protein [Leucobacter chromiisoli]
MRKHGAGRGIVYLMTGTVGGQFITLAGLPVLSRLYSPDEFGHYSFIVALAGVAISVATFRLDAAAMLPTSTHQVRALVWLSLSSALLVSVLFAISLHVFSELEMFGLHEYPFLAVWVGAFTLSGALFGLFSQLSLRKRQYGLVARRSFLRASVSTASQAAMGVGPSRISGGLLFGGLIGQLVGIASMVRSTRDLSAFPDLRQLRPALRRYWRFPAVFAPSALLNTLGLQAPLIFVTAYFGVAAGGQLGIAERAVAIPVTLVGTTVGQVIEAEVAKHTREGGGGLRSTYLRFSLLLSLAGIAVAAGGSALGGVLVPWAFGSDWDLAGVMVQIIAVNAGVRLLVSPLSKFLVVLQQSLAVTLLDILRVCAMGAAIWATVSYEHDLTTALWLIYSALTFTYIVTWLYGFWIVGKK